MKYIETYTSCMHVHVRYYVYEPKVIIRTKGVIQIHHGLSEHADLYEHFASFLLNQGFVVVVSDFVGHGKSLIDFEQGYFGEEHGPENLVKDMHHLLMVVRENYPDVPYFLLGVNLGSVLIRKYMVEYGDYIEGVILLGTPARIEHRFIKRGYLYLMRMLKGPSHKADAFFKALTNSRNKKISYSSSSVDWLTSDEDEKNKFLNDPMTHFSYTIQGYRDIVRSIYEVNNDDFIKRTPQHLSIYIAMGEKDPTAIGMPALAEKYKKVPVKDVTLKVFKEKRHALLFEKDKNEVYLDILEWLNERTYL